VEIEAGEGGVGAASIDDRCAAVETMPFRVQRDIDRVVEARRPDRERGVRRRGEERQE